MPPLYRLNFTPNPPISSCDFPLCPPRSGFPPSLPLPCNYCTVPKFQFDPNTEGHRVVRENCYVLPSLNKSPYFTLLCFALLCLALLCFTLLYFTLLYFTLLYFTLLYSTTFIHFALPYNFAPKF